MLTCDMVRYGRAWRAASLPQNKCNASRRIDSVTAIPGTQVFELKLGDGAWTRRRWNVQRRARHLGRGTMLSRVGLEIRRLLLA
jgi:hypothetical protein